MERLIVLSAQMQVILEYYKLDPSRAPSSTAIDALKDALAKCSRVLLAARIESASARTARKADGVGVAPGQPVPPQPAPHAPPAAFPDFPPSVFPDRGQLLSAADQLLMWRELKYLGVFPAEAERLFVRSAADLADRVSDGVRSAVARAFEPLNARPGPETDSLQGRPPQITCQAVCLAARGIYEYFNRLVTGGRPSGREAPGPDASETSFLQNLGNSLCHSIAEEAISGLIRQGAVGEKAARAATRELLGPAIDFISAHSSACLSGFSPEVASFMRQCRYSRSYRLTLENLGLASFVPVLCFCRVSAANEIYGAPTFQAAFTSCSQFQPHTVFPGLCIVDVLSPGEVSGLVKNRFELAAARERRDLAPFYEKVSVLKSLSSLDREEEEALQAGPAESTEPGR